ncbi:hypothetical protein V476_06365 [Pseudomonas syringae KCTC 12500]|nr:hypothetical protein V476_06365 [Pseudomonas syringae KCTC 12500]POR86719.1 hypothetical protein BKM21_06615 [Pseudomonas syringae pv. syringae]
MLRVEMQFVTLCVTQRLFFVRWIWVRLRSPFRPSASYFDEAKVTKAFRSVSGPTSSGSFALALIQDSAVTDVALCVVRAIVVEKHFCGSGCGLTIVAHAPAW